MSRIPKIKVKSTWYLDEKDDEEPGEEPQQTVQYVHSEVVPYNTRFFPFKSRFSKKKFIRGKNVKAFLFITYYPYCVSEVPYPEWQNW
jgi:hypothetical protein